MSLKMTFCGNDELL